MTSDLTASAINRALLRSHHLSTSTSYEYDEQRSRGHFDHREQRLHILGGDIFKYSLFSAHKRARGERALIPEQARGDEEYPEAAQSSPLCTTFREVRAQLQFDGMFWAQHEPCGDENLLRLVCFAQSQESSALLPWPSVLQARVAAPLPPPFARPPTTTEPEFITVPVGMTVLGPLYAARSQTSSLHRALLLLADRETSSRPSTFLS